MNALAQFMAKVLLVVAWLSSPALVACLVAFLITGSWPVMVAGAVFFIACWTAVAITFGPARGRG